MTTAKPKNSVICTCCFLSIFLVCVTTRVSAEQPPVVNGDFVGDHVTYFNVTQNSPVPIPMGDPGPYGMPVVEDDDLSFRSPSFSAIADIDQLQDTTDGFLGFRLEADPGYALTELALFEFGAIEFHSSSGGSVDTWTNVVAPVYIEVESLVIADGTADGHRLDLAQPLFFSTQIPISPQGISPPGWNSMDDPNATKWIATLDIDLVAEVASAFPDLFAQQNIEGVGSLSFTMNNILTAGAEDVNSLAFIDKKYAGIRPVVSTVSVPEPVRCAGEMALLGMAMCGVVARRLRG